jgi:uncharacterized membrane protein HdeD (DUF308 family)
MNAASAPTPSASPATPAEIDARLADRWGWFVALGVLYVVLGTFGLIAVGPLSLASALLIAVLFIIGGVGQLIQAFRCAGWRSTAVHVLGAILYVVAGGLLLAQPLVGLVTITLVIGAIIFAAGVTRIVIAFQHRPDPGWTWLAVSGVVGVLLGLVILAGLPGNALWVLGLLVAVELLMEGWSMVLMGFALRRWKRTAAAAA